MYSAVEPLRLHYAFCVACKAKSLAPAIELSQIAYIKTASMQSKETLSNTTQILLSFARAVGNDCGVHFVNMHILRIADDRISSTVLCANAREIYVHNIRAAKIMIKSRRVLSLPTDLGKDALDARILGISHLADLCLYNPSN